MFLYSHEYELNLWSLLLLSFLLLYSCYFVIWVSHKNAWMNHIYFIL